MMLVVTGVSTLIHLYSVGLHEGDRGYARFFAYLNFFVFSMLAAGPGGQLPPAHRRLGVRRRRLVPADLLLVPAHDRDDARASRRSSSTSSATSGSCSARSSSSATPARSTSSAPSTAARSVQPARRRRPHRGLHPAARRRVREVRADPAAHLAPRRDGGPDPGLRADPRGDDGHRRRLPDRAHAPAVRAGARGRRRSARSSARVTLLVAGTIGLVVTDLKRVIAYSTMSQIGYMIMARQRRRLRRRACST